jgi:nucleotide-binding universal stress UspA family protein
MPAKRQGVWTIVVGIDGSEHAKAALRWAIELARPLIAKVVAVYALYIPTSALYSDDITLTAQFDEKWRADLKREFEDKWCAPLRGSGVAYQTVVEEGRPAKVIAGVADRVGADLIVVGRRGRAGVAELVLGSVSHELTHHAAHPVAIVSKA